MKKNYNKRAHQTAYYNGKVRTATPTEWSRIIGCTIYDIERGLKAHYSIQALIDEEYTERQRILNLHRQFCFRVSDRCVTS